MSADGTFWRFLCLIDLSISAVLKAIKEQTEGNDEADELVLDQIKFTKFTPEIAQAIGNNVSLSLFILPMSRENRRSQFLEPQRLWIDHIGRISKAS